MEKSMKENICMYMHIYVCITVFCSTAEIKNNTVNQLYFKGIFKNNLGKKNKKSNLGGEKVYYLKPQ